MDDLRAIQVRWQTWCDTRSEESEPIDNIIRDALGLAETLINDLAQEQERHERTQEWLERFMGEQSKGTLRAIRAEANVERLCRVILPLADNAMGYDRSTVRAAALQLANYDPTSDLPERLKRAEQEARWLVQDIRPDLLGYPPKETSK